MKAVEIHGYGSARAVLRLRDVARPVPAADEILIENHATSINPVDCAARSGYGQNFFSHLGWGELPWILGRDASGVVVAKGGSVSAYAIGDEVYAAPPIGCYAEYVAVRADDAAPKPANLTHLEAASFPFVALTTWSALVKDAGLTPETAAGRKVVIPRAAGGVGCFAIQLLKAWGAEVAGICSSRNVDLVRKLGADVVIDYTQEDFRDRLRDYDVAFDLIGRKSDFDGIESDYKGGMETGGAEYDELVMSVLRRDGVYATICSPKVAFTNRYGFDRGMRLAQEEFEARAAAAKARGVRYRWSFFSPDGSALRQITALLEAGAIRPVVDRVYPITEMVAAHEYCESKQARGKIVIDIRS